MESEFEYAVMATPMAELSNAEMATVLMLGGIWLSFALVVMAVSIVIYWKLFTKAGQPGWKSLIPLYSSYILFKIAGRPGWWLLLLLIPLVNIVIAVILSIDLAKSFGRSSLFGVIMLLFLGLVGYAVLAFGGDAYVGPGGISTDPDSAAPDDLSTPNNAATDPAAPTIS